MDNNELKPHKNNSIKTVLISAGLMLLGTILALSFAFFTVEYEVGDLYTAGGNSKNNQPSITFTENKDGIELNGAYPMPDAVGIAKSDEYVFTVKNNDTARNVKIKVYLQVAETNTLTDDLVRIKYNDDVYTVNTLDVSTPIDTGYNKAYSLGSFNLRPHASKSNSLKIWINEIGTIENALNKTWKSKIVVVPEYTNEEAPPLTGKGTEVLKALMNEASITDYNSGNKGEMFTFTHPEAEQTTGWSEEERTDYRYIGASPNNYINFNDETWRIIGVFTIENETGIKEQRIKIIREASIGDLAWDSGDVNEWPTSSLSTLLNTGDYYNRAGTYSTRGLTVIAKRQIDSVKWYLGGSRASSNLGGPDYYNFERGNITYATDHTEETRSANYIANVGLMYPSDYVYTYANGVDNTCYTDGYNCKVSASGIPTNGWLYNSLSTSFEWLISPSALYSNAASVREPTGFVDANVFVSSAAISSRPCVYLRSDIQITGGDGTSGSPYILGS